MSVVGQARELFIVDNSVSGWTGLRYLEEWASIAKAFDIATGYFETSALLALEGKWQGLEKIRILMGSETTASTKKALIEGVMLRAKAVLNAGLETDKESNPLLTGVAGIVDALKRGQIEVRVFDKEKFHAKAYITHAKLEVVGSQALVGSSNFTRPGLTQNVELNVQVQSAREVAQLQAWFEEHWNLATDVTEGVISTIERHTRPYTPFEVYAKALQEYFKGHEISAREWEESRSRMFADLDLYQKEAYWSLLKIANQHGGAFLCDGVGLGKTFVGLMLIERLVLHEGKRVVLLAPKSARDGVWYPHLKEWLPHIGGVGGSADFSNLAVFSHTDLGRGGDFPDRFKRMSELADVVIIDEAHHFRNTGSPGDEVAGRDPSRYHRLFQMLDGSERPKSVFLLTATPINNSLTDFRHLLELFTRRDDQFFAKTLGINSVAGHFRTMERDLRERLGGTPVDLQDHMPVAQELLATDSIFQHIVVQRSRAYARASQQQETGNSAMFPIREAPSVASYSVKKTYNRVLEMFEEAFHKTNPLFTLAMYYPLGWYKGADATIDKWEENRQQQVVGLIRTQFLKRFESSVRAFESSCDRLLLKLLAFVEVHSTSESEKKRLEKFKARHRDILNGVKNDLFTPEEDLDQDVLSDEMLEAVERLDPGDYDIPEMLAETYSDLDQLVKFLDEIRQFDPKSDDKLQKLIRLLKSKDLDNEKVLIFSEFSDTARYLQAQLSAAGVGGVFQIDSNSKLNRADVIRRFAPYYNRSSSPRLLEKGQEEIRVLVSTDVLSEGLNLQDATRLINYDIHWNPVRLMQRIGRVDRRMSPQIETAIVRDHPGRAGGRGKIKFWNFLPPDELNRLLSLYATVTRKTLLISETFGIEGRQLLTPDDEYNALREFSHSYEGQASAIEKLHLEYHRLLLEDPTLEERLRQLPGSVYSGRKGERKTPSGVFFCYALPALDKSSEEFTEAAGVTKWYYWDAGHDRVLEDPQEIQTYIRSSVDTPRNSSRQGEDLAKIRAKVQKHIKNTYLKRVDAPVGVKPILKCWMEVVD